MSEMTLSVRLKADGSGLVGEVRVAQAELDKLAGATGKAGGAAGKAARDIDRLDKETRQAARQSSQFNGVQRSLTRTLLGLGSAYLSLRGAMNLVRAYRDQEQAVAALDQSIQSMGRTTEGLSQQLQALASQIQSEGVIGDEAIIKGQSFLTTYGNITDELLPRTTRIMADIAAKMGGDTVQAANLLGKASMGLTGELSRMGITLSEEAKRSKDFRLILGEIEAQVGGMNRALRDTSTGALDAFSNDFGDLKEDMGKLVSSIIEGFLPSLTTMVSDLRTGVLPAFADWLEKIGATKRALTDLSLTELRIRQDRLLNERRQLQEQVKNLGRPSGGVLGISPINNAQLAESQRRLLRLKTELQDINRQMLALQSSPGSGGNGVPDVQGGSALPSGTPTETATSAVQSFTDSINQKRLALILDEDQLLRYNAAVLFTESTNAAASEQMLATTDAYLSQKAAIEANAEAQRRQVELQRQGQRIIEATRAPLEAYEAQVRRITEIYRGGGLGEGAGADSTYIRAVTQAQADFIAQSEQDAIQWTDIWSSAGNRFAAGVGDAVASAVVEQKNLADGMRQVLRGVAKQVISTLVEIGVKKLALMALEKAGLISQTAVSVGAAQTAAAAWAPAATFASLASFGSNSVPAMAGMSATFAVAEGIQLAGVAHDGLDVVPQDGTYLLQGGERIVKKDDNQKLTKALDNGLGGVTVVQNIHLNAVDTANIDRWILSRREVFKGLAVQGVQEAYNGAGQAGPLG